MQRKNGYLDLDSYFGLSYDELKKQGLILKTKNLNFYGNNFSEWIKINGENYNLKISNNWEKELIVSEFLKLIGIPCVTYDIAILDNKEVLLSKDFRKEGFNYITGSSILKNYAKTKKEFNPQYFDEFFNRSTEFFSATKELNNLENIWDAFLTRYNDKEDCEKIVAKLVTNLKNQALTRVILLKDRDYHCDNWMIEEGDEINLVPSFDHELSLQKEKDYGQIFGIFNYDILYGNFNQLESFLNTSAREDIEDFFRLFEKANPKVFATAIYNVEKTKGITLKNKVDLMKVYVKNYSALEEIIINYRGKYGR